MNNESKRKYFNFPVIMMFIMFGTFLFSYVNQTFSNDYILDRYDITGMTGVFRIFILVINILILAFCAFKGREKENYDYKFNKIFAVIFFILAIVGVLSFICIRNEEEKQTEELYSQINGVYGDDIYNAKIDLTSKKKMNKYNELLEGLQEDEFYKRKTQIYAQMQNDSKVSRYFYLLVYWNHYNDLNIIKPTEEESYYAIFSRFILLDLVCCAFYIVSMKDEFYNKQTSILNREEM